jgi:hypothetical protein
MRRRSVAREYHASCDKLAYFAIPLLLPGITLNTSPVDYQPIKELRETRFNGKFWESVEGDTH